MNRSASALLHRYASLGAATAAGILPAARAALDLRLEGGGAADRQAVPQVALHVAATGTPSPFLPPGPFTATWEGEISVELRGDYQFRAESRGEFELQIAGTNLVSGGAPGREPAWSPPIRLRKGSNPFRATFSRADDGEAFVRLLWQGRGLPPGPVPPTAYTSSNTPATDAPESRRARGRELFLHLRCGRCHAVEAATPVPELAMDAPRFEGIGPERSREWIASRLLNPGSRRDGSAMPRLLHGPSAAGEAEALAAWLTSLPSSAHPAPEPGSVPVGRSLAETLRCATCHVLPGEAADPAKVSLEGVAAKFSPSPGSLARFLQRPSADFAWSRMPDYGLTPGEAAHLSSWLLSVEAPTPTPIPRVPTPPERVPTPPERVPTPPEWVPTPPERVPTPPEWVPTPPEWVERGRDLAGTRGCFACHPGPGKPGTPALPLSGLRADAWTRGCLADVDPGSAAPAGMPWYNLTAEERADLRAFGSTDRASLGRHVPAEFAGRWMAGLRCGGCHEAGSGIPQIVGAGAKLRPEWMARLLGGSLSGKSRPWLPARMPAFPTHGAALAEGLAAAHGRRPRSDPDPAWDAAAAADGRRLSSSASGFACVTCHPIGRGAATAIFEAPGINFALISERLLPDYFGRWLLNPQVIEPGTKMPQYFDEDGNSALADYAGGDGPKTIHALWNYIRLGSRIEAPTP